MYKDMNILIGITGGISAYKACSLINFFKSEGAKINVIMTEHATKFISPITVETLAGRKVYTDMFSDGDYSEVAHIKLAKEADLILIVPATANIIGKVANGIADDMLSTTIMATKKPVIFAPAMNNQMFENRIVQDNIKKLEDYGYKFIEPVVGHLACGGKEIGKLPNTKTLVKRTEEIIKEEGLWN